MCNAERLCTETLDESRNRNVTAGAFVEPVMSVTIVNGPLISKANFRERHEISNIFSSDIHLFLCLFLVKPHASKNARMPELQRTARGTTSSRALWSALAI
jgi:hypothetical protein